MTDRLLHFFGEGASEFHSDPAELLGERARGLLGGKGSSLHAMTAFGLPVPPGFTIVTTACKHYYDNDRRRPPGLDDLILAAMARLERVTGRVFGAAERPLLVSVRSGAAASMPGMMDTVLNCGDPKKGDPRAQLFAAVDEVFRSWMNGRAVEYRRNKNITGLTGTAVTVQAMCPAEAAGVLFTINANTGRTDEMVVEAVPGLGESLVLGEVVPDNYILARPGFAPKMRRPAGPKPVLDDARLAELGALGVKVEEYYGHALDIEWGLEGGKLWLLQARKVKSAAAEQEALRLAEVDRLAGLVAKRTADGNGHAPAGNGAAGDVPSSTGAAPVTVWSRYNLAETLPKPLPMTFSLMREFHSPAGGAFALRRRVGCTPELPAGTSYVELICGRLFYDLALEGKTFFAGHAYGFDLSAMRAEPRKALYPRPALDRSRTGWWGRVRFLWRSMRAGRTLEAARKFMADWLDFDVFPRVVAEHREERARDLSGLTDAEVIKLFRDRARRYWHELGVEAFLATALADHSLEQLKSALTRALGPAEAEKLAARAAATGIHSTTGDFTRMLDEVAAGKRSREDFLAAHGHRATDELELAMPRWREDPATVDEMIARFRGPAAHHPTHGAAQVSASATADSVRTGATADSVRTGATADTASQTGGKPGNAPPAATPPTEPADPVAEEIAGRCGFFWGPTALAELKWVRRYLPFRETAKHHVMLGYELIRLALLELDRRWGLAGGVFWLEDRELDTARTWPDLKDVIAKRKHERDLLLKVPLPDVIFADRLEEVGNPPPPPSSAEYEGLAVSPGVAEGPAKVVFDPHTDRPEGKGYILICPSTDPGWTPLFANAAGLVLERGGMLSHGSLIAREFGLPAVAGIDRITRAVQDGRRIRVDGNAGKVYLLED